MQVLPEPSAAPPSPNNWPVAVRKTHLTEGSGNTGEASNRIRQTSLPLPLKLRSVLSGGGDFTPCFKIKVLTFLLLSEEPRTFSPDTQDPSRHQKGQISVKVLPPPRQPSRTARPQRPPEMYTCTFALPVCWCGQRLASAPGTLQPSPADPALLQGQKPASTGSACSGARRGAGLEPCTGVPVRYFWGHGNHSLHDAAPVPAWLCASQALSAPASTRPLTELGQQVKHSGAEGTKDVLKSRRGAAVGAWYQEEAQGFQNQQDQPVLWLHQPGPSPKGRSCLSPSTERETTGEKEDGLL